MQDYTSLPPDLPAPVDDGAADHLTGLRLPDVALTATDGETVSIARLRGRSVIYVYPRTGEPGQPNLTPDWDAIPGARGCTPQSCGFRDHFADLKRLGVDHVFGLSTQPSDDQRDAAERLHLPFPLLSDRHRALAMAARLPTFTVAGHVLLKRLAMVVDDGTVTKTFYPVFPPDRNAEEVVAWLAGTVAAPAA